MFSAVLLSVLLAPARATSLWPLPKNVVFGPSAGTLPPDFSFTTSSTSPALLAAFSRTLATMRVAVPPVLPFDGPITGALLSVRVTLASDDEDLTFNVSEAYSLDVSGAAGKLEADTLYGALRGLETLSQLAEYVPASGSVIVRAARIVDAPRFPHRGALVDTSRHFIPVGTLLAFVDAMAYNKLNVLHWHLADDPSFPWQSVTFPALAGRGAWGGLPSHTYSPEAVQQVIGYARARGVRVMPEFDTPGHTTSWGLGQPNFTTPCYFPNGSLAGTGPVNPTLDSTFAFLAALYAEVAATFPDSYMHIGGDEVSFACWASNPSINAWMAANGIAPGDYAGLESYYVQKNLQLVAAAGKRAVGWQELFDNHLKLAAGTVVNVWKYHNSPSTSPPPKPGGPTWQSEMANVTAAGFLTLLSSPWYLNVVTYGAADIWQFYAADPHNFTGTPAQKALVIGGELSMWGEWVDSTNLQSRTWPRGSAVAERLWSAATVTDPVDAAARLEVHRCRMLARGITAEPIGPSYCVQEFEPPYAPPWSM